MNFGAREKCAVCDKTVYSQERLAIEKDIFHKTCFKCTHCQKVLTLGNYAALSGKFYCKPHYSQLFRTKGNYEEGFGEESSKKKWAPQVVNLDSQKDFTSGKHEEPKPKAPEDKPSSIPETKTEIKPVVAPVVAKEEPVKPSQTNHTEAALTNGPSANKLTGMFEDKLTEQNKQTPQPIQQTNSQSRMRFGTNAEKCAACDKTVYSQERLAIEKDVFHKTCFKCTHCQKVLTLGNYAALSGKFYCKPHYSQLFHEKGNYEEGFGEESSKKKWAPQVVNLDSQKDFTGAKHEEPKPKAPEEKHTQIPETKTEIKPVVAPVVAKEEPVKPSQVRHTEAALTNGPSTNKLTGMFEDKLTEQNKPTQQPQTQQTNSQSRMRFGTNAEKCAACGKTVYSQERLAIEKDIFHKTCFKCTHCQKVLTLGNFAALSGKFYCKPHYSQLFHEKGNYEEGFGEESSKKKWAPQVINLDNKKDFTGAKHEEPKPKSPEMSRHAEKVDAKESAYDEPTYEEPAFEEQPTDEPTDEPTFEEQPIEEPIDEQTYEEPAFEEQPIEESTDEPTCEEPEENVDNEQVIEEPNYEEPNYEEPNFEEPNFEEPIEGIKEEEQFNDEVL